MRRPTTLPTIQVSPPLWWRALRWVVVTYLRWCDRCIAQEMREYQAIADASGGDFAIGPKYLRNCEAQRQALRERIARWDR